MSPPTIALESLDPHHSSLGRAERAWWKSAIVYQIYPISFFDSNGDGLGDLNGIHSKLGYLRDLGVDILWLSPIYRSPLADMGYDIADYYAIDPRYGTLDDWDRLIKGVHDRGMKLVMDLVVNHTSDEHDWFVQSRSSKDHPKRNWYIWRPGKPSTDGDKCPPNNWRSVFQGPAWDYDEATDEYYLHLYLTKQPDLNWDNVEVREAAHNMMRFWLDRGCDGFRVNGLPDAPVIDENDPTQPASMHYANGPRVHGYIKEMNQKVLSHYDIFTVGEAPFSHSADDLAEYALPRNGELKTIFQFELMDIDSSEPLEPLMPKPWKLSDLKNVVEKWQTFKREEGFWNTSVTLPHPLRYFGYRKLIAKDVLTTSVFIENHDQSRVVSRFGNDSKEWRSYSAKLFALLEISQGGTLFIYQGQELGLKNFPESWSLEEYKDAATINFWNRIKERRKAEAKPGGEVDMTDVMKGLQHKARDHSRVPMPWTADPHAGFTTGSPWMRVNDDYVDGWNVQAQVGDNTSVYAFYKLVLSYRKKSDLLVCGDFRMIEKYRDHPQVFAFLRTFGAATAVVLLNFGQDEVTLALEDTDISPNVVGIAELTLDNYRDLNTTAQPDREVLQGSVVLRGYQGKLYVK